MEQTSSTRVTFQKVMKAKTLLLTPSTIRSFSYVWTIPENRSFLSFFSFALFPSLTTAMRSVLYKHIYVYVYLYNHSALLASTKHSIRMLEWQQPSFFYPVNSNLGIQPAKFFVIVNCLIYYEEKKFSIMIIIIF